MRYLGVEQNTDLRDRDTKLTWHQSEEAAQRWLNDWDNPHAYPHPEKIQNWHRRLRHVVVLPTGWKANQKRIQERLEAMAGSMYQGNKNDALVRLAYADKLDVLYKKTELID